VFGCVSVCECVYVSVWMCVCSVNVIDCADVYDTTMNVASVQKAGMEGMKRRYQSRT
jgi:hypothetical protein